MARAIDLTSKEWRDLVFAGKNQVYGAYEIRKTSSQRHLMSVGIVLLLVAIFSALPMIMKKMFPAGNVIDKDTSGVITLVEYNPLEKDKEIFVKPLEAVPNLKPTVKFTAPEIVPDDKVMEAEEMLTQDAYSDSGASISIITNEGVVGGTIDPADVDISAIGHTEIEVPKEYVDQMPETVGGIKELMNYLSNNIKYPIPSVEMGVEGSVQLRFVVGKDGSIQDVVILRSAVDSYCDKEAVRVVKSMPKWIPGRQNGVAVAVYYTLPVRFKLN